jgi:class 3 adenylate cyclase/CHASE2 domain-containing sensor protein
MLRKISPKELLSVFVIVVLATAVGVLLPRLLPTFKAGENWLKDFRFATMAAPEPQNKDVVIIAVTEETLATLHYRSPVDREFLVRLLTALEAAKPKAIGIDILFDQPTEPAKDNALRQKLLSLSVPVVVASAGKAEGLTKPQKEYLSRFTEGMKTGLVNLVKDRTDGTVRWIYPGDSTGGSWTPGLVPHLAEIIGKEAPKMDLPLVYRPGPGKGENAFRVFPAHAAAFLPKPWFAGKVILIGADLPLSDRHRTPYTAALGGQAGNLPGVFIFAHAMAQLIDGRTGASPGAFNETALIAALAVIGMLFALLDLPLWAKGVGYMASLGLLWGGGFALYGMGGVMIPLLAPTFGFATSSSMSVAYIGRRDRQQKKFIRDAFSRYLSPALVNQLVDDPEQLNVGGERRELTYIFTDLASFTTFTERTEPSILVPLLNDYLSAMCRIFFKHGATIDKIVGDAVVGFFNAPMNQANHQVRAVALALELDAFCQDFVAEQAEKGLKLGITRIGVHSGPAIIGNFGGEAFFDYTAHGDMVNTAARLESVNKHLGTRICISGVTARACANVAFRPVGALVLKGKTEGLEVFEPLTDGEVGSAATAAYREAFELMENNDPGALEGFRKVLELNASDPLAKFHIGRLENGQTGATIVMEQK